MQTAKPLLILVAGPYRSGTNDDPDLIAANVRAMTVTALELYRMGHMPVLGEWFVLPLIEAAGSKRMGDEVFNELFHPVAVKLISHCDAVLRIGGPSAGADEMVRAGQVKKKIIFLPKGRNTCSSGTVVLVVADIHIYCTGAKLCSGNCSLTNKVLSRVNGREQKVIRLNGFYQEIKPG